MALEPVKGEVVCLCVCMCSRQRCHVKAAEDSSTSSSRFNPSSRPQLGRAEKK